MEQPYWRQDGAFLVSKLRALSIVRFKRAAANGWIRNIQGSHDEGTIGPIS